MNRILWVFILSFFLVDICSAQKIDDLLIELKAAEDTSRVIILNQLSEAYFKSNAKPKKGSKVSEQDKAYEFAMEALKSSEKIKYKKGMAISYFNLGKCQLNKKDYRGAELSFLNSSELAKELKEHKLVLHNIEYIFRFHKELGNTNNSIAYADMKSAYKDVMLKEITTDQERTAKDLHSALKKTKALDSLLEIQKARVKQGEEKVKQVIAAKAPAPITLVKYKSVPNYKLAVVFLMMFLLVSGFAIWLFELKNKNKRLLEKAEAKNIQLLKKLSEQKEDSIEKDLIKTIADLSPQEEMNLRIAQVLSQANFIIQKNEILLKLENKYIGLKESKVEDLSRQVSELGDVIYVNYDLEKDWEDFLLQFETAFPGYLEEVKEKNKDLSEHEIKVITLQKIALTVQEMASILHVSEAEIERCLETLNTKKNKVKSFSS